MKVFAYHYGANGISMWRIWQPLNRLKEFGIDAKRNPDHSDRLEIPLEGKCLHPGVKSHGDVARENDLIWSTYVTNAKDRGRLVAQTHYAPVVIDIDDDVTAVDKSNMDYEKWTEEWKKAEMSVEIETDEDLEFFTEKRKEYGGEIVPYEGKKYYVRTGFDPAENVIELIREASGVTVSTPRMAKVYGKYNKNVCIIPNAYEPDKWGEMKRKDDGKIRIALFGANGHFYDWKMIAPQIKRLLSEHKNCVLVTNVWKVNSLKRQGETDTEAEGELILHADFEDIPEDQLELHHFSEIDRWHEFLAESGADVGIAPLQDSAFNRAKSAIKYIEWSALGVPGVYSMSEVYENHVIHGRTGYLAKPGEFYKYMKRLVTDETGRRLMGARAKKDVQDNHHQRDASRKLAEFFKETRKRYEEGKISRFGSDSGTVAGGV